MEKLVYPKSYGERERLAKHIRQTLDVYNLRNNWLIQQLRNEGLIVSKTNMCDILAMRYSGPKMDEFLARAERICTKYEQSCFAKAQSGN